MENKESNKVYAGVKGFLIIECEKCHNVSQYFTKKPLSVHTCRKCKHDMPLVFDKLKKAYVTCECGSGQVVYRTNLDEKLFDAHCTNVDCHMPITMELIKKKKNSIGFYTPVGTYRVKKSDMD